MKTTQAIALLLIIASFIIGIYFYSQMPELVASHWNEKGEVDGYMPKFWGIFLIPIISITIFILLILLPKMDPLKKNIDTFKNYYDSFILVVFIFLFYIYALTIIWNLGFQIPMGTALTPAFAFIFYYAGILISKAKRNYFIGIRTPWTLDNDYVWNKTHKLGATLFKISGIIALTGIIFPNYSFWFILAPIIIFSIILTIYSYIIFKELKTKENRVATLNKLKSSKQREDKKITIIKK
jgi:uncharacterized membrane protein